MRKLRKYYYRRYYYIHIYKSVFRWQTRSRGEQTRMYLLLLLRSYTRIMHVLYIYINVRITIFMYKRVNGQSQWGEID